jgi:hypothetical protein
VNWASGLILGSSSFPECVEESGRSPVLECVEKFLHVSIHCHDILLKHRKFTKIKTSVALVRERTIPTERSPLVGEVSANVCVCRLPRGERDESLRPYSRISRPAVNSHFTNKIQAELCELCTTLLVA